MAAVAASTGFGTTAAKAAISAPREQPTPVTLVIHSWPFDTVSTRSPSVMWSTGPLIATAQ
ncbi:hypothetical protein MAJHIDBO_00631 [Propionibacterium freudenreichii subsp. shermanii]|nr:hypothetical protein MAJHIDBO_00631 [Propionibacterium freudenreichii subsp. shermanii]SPS08447.1 hypothetical protein MAJHIDBO_00631 [Propionibacterium freudenreichii subsp. shermanii]